MEGRMERGWRAEEWRGGDGREDEGEKEEQKMMN